jgi:hypothetical protein
LTFNAKDNCCFAADHALTPLLDAATPVYRLFGQEARLRTHVNHDPGTHNYLKENREALYRMIGDQFFAGQSDFRGEEIPVELEVKTAEALQVKLPPDQATLHSLAMALSKDLPREPALPTDRDSAIRWQAARRESLGKIVRSHEYASHADQIELDDDGRYRANLWKLRIGETWTVPAAEIIVLGAEPRGTTIVIADAGRKKAGAAVGELLRQGRRVVAVDLFDTGESTIADKAWLWNLYVSAVGERPLGLKASQLGSVARWLQGSTKAPVSVLAIGPGSSIVALVAAGLEASAIGELELRDAPASLREPIEANLTFEKAPDRFCFGLLEAFDVPQLVALVAPRKVVVAGASSRAKASLAALRAWYATLGIDFQPAP